MDEVNQANTRSKRHGIMLSGEAEFCRLLDSLPTGAYICDAEGLIVYFNSAAARLWGREPKLKDPADRFCGSFKLMDMDGKPIRHHECWMARALRGNRDYHGFEIIIERPDGTRVFALAYASPLHDKTGKLKGAVNVLVDVSDRRQAEESLRRSEMAKEQFLATLAHELRNPLAPLRNAAYLLRMEKSASVQGQWALDVIERQTQQMTRLIDDLLDVSRISRNKLELRKERVELSEVLQIAIETSRPLIEAAGHELTVSVPEGRLYLHADLTRLAQAVANLLNNAAKYTERSGHIWLTAERDGAEVVIRIRDNGMGIPREMIGQVFDMFSQVSRSLNRPQGGLGIGLSLVKRLVEMHGGTVEATSAGLDRGSEFIVRLPALLPEVQQMRHGHGEAGDGVNGTPMRLLIADDNRDSADSLAMLLKITGHDVRTVYNGADAVSAMRDFAPDVALLDIGMPEMNGYEVAREIREHFGVAGHDVVLIALTGWGQEADRRRSKEAGFDHHLVKPVNPGVLLKLLAGIQARLGELHHH